MLSDTSAIVLQTQDYRVSQEKEPCIRVNTRELDRELFTRLSTFYTKCYETLGH